MSIWVSHVSKSFGSPPANVLSDVSFKIDDADFFVITGKSGSGKSTLLYLLSSLDHPTSGEIILDGTNITKLSDKEVHEFRNRNMGFVFQFHYLLPELDALENVLMPALKRNLVADSRDYAVELLQTFELGHRLHHRPAQLSGGEQQRVAIARALVMKPKYVFADEPTGNLDSSSGDNVMAILKKMNQEKKTTIVYVTHDPDYAKMASKHIHLVDGRITPPDSSHSPA